MRAGRLGKRMTIERRLPGTDAEGAPNGGWVTVGSVWAEVQPLTGVELLLATQEEQRMQVQINVRCDPTSTNRPDHNSRLLLGDRVFEVQTVQNIAEHNRELQLLAIERVR